MPVSAYFWYFVNYFIMRTTSHHRCYLLATLGVRGCRKRGLCARCSMSSASALSTSMVVWRWIHRTCSDRRGALITKDEHRSLMTMLWSHCSVNDGPSMRIIVEYRYMYLNTVECSQMYSHLYVSLLLLQHRANSAKGALRGWVWWIWQGGSRRMSTSTASSHPTKTSTSVDIENQDADAAGAAFSAAACKWVSCNPIDVILTTYISIWLYSFKTSYVCV